MTKLSASASGLVVSTGCLGFPRMGPKRELKFALEKYWSNKISQKELWEVAHSVEEKAWSLQAEAGIDRIAVGDFALYDLVLSWTEWLGLIPARFRSATGDQQQPLAPGIDRMFAMARGINGAAALDMTKWFDSNYHYEVPELEPDMAHGPTTDTTSNFAVYLDSVRRAIQKYGASKVAPVILGPATYVQLAKVVATNGASNDNNRSHQQQEQEAQSVKKSVLARILPVYKSLLDTLAGMGVEEVQIHEPALVWLEDDLPQAAQQGNRADFYHSTREGKQHVFLRELFHLAYGSPQGAHASQSGRSQPLLPAPAALKVNLISYFEDVGAKSTYEWLISLPVDIISLDFTRGNNIALVRESGFPQSKTLGVGIIDARTVWGFRPQQGLGLLQELVNLGVSHLRIQPSSSLQFVPWDLEPEHNGLKLNISESSSSSADSARKILIQVLSFATQKLEEVKHIADYVRTLPSANPTPALAKLSQAWEQYETALLKGASGAKNVSAQQLGTRRSLSFQERRKLQLQGLPLLPTTTIGSFPQTVKIRSLRQQFLKGQMSREDYERAIDDQIEQMIQVQEEIGLDILVHGEPERTDMVEFFAQQLVGFAFTSNGWVQSYGSRCVRPPIIYQNVSRPKAMTLREFVYAQSLTQKPVKGMLTGPVTILNWSYPRIDVSRREQAFQIAKCLREEIHDLESVKCRVIQVDEPALREGMPLRGVPPLAVSNTKSPKEEYLRWAVDAFLVATSGAAPATQIHTHMCYCEFEDCMHAIDAMDTDVNSIENARSSDATLKAFKAIGYDKGLGPGVYDIHSPVVPTVESIYEKIKTFLQALPAQQLVVNPDCGLKTRTWEKTIPALKNMVEATQRVRKELQASQAHSHSTVL